MLPRPAAEPAFPLDKYTFYPPSASRADIKANDEVSARRPSFPHVYDVLPVSLAFQRSQTLIGYGPHRPTEAQIQVLTLEPSTPPSSPSPAPITIPLVTFPLSELLHLSSSSTTESTPLANRCGPCVGNMSLGCPGSSGSGREIRIWRVRGRDPDISLNNMRLRKYGDRVYASKQRTGTKPFMAIEVLRPDLPAHMYRHDLESKFYVLIWTTSRFHKGDEIAVPP
jgi:hypothetical protein